MAKPVLLEDETPVAAGTVIVGVGTPDVKGTLLEAAVAPEKAGASVAAEVLGFAVVFLGLRTLQNGMLARA